MADSLLMTIIKSDQDWPAKKAALVAFDFQPAARSEGPMDDTPPPVTPDSWDEMLWAIAIGLLTEEQEREVLAARTPASA